MSPLPPRVLKEGHLVLVDDRVYRITEDPHAGGDNLPGNRITLELDDQLTGEHLSKGFGWDEHLWAYEPTTVEIEGAGGKVGTLVVEPAGIADEDDRIPIRWRVLDENGNEIGSSADLRTAVGEGYDGNKAMVNLIGFLGAAAEAVDMERRGRTSENADLFPRAVMDWADHNSVELEVSGIELAEALGVELD